MKTVAAQPKRTICHNPDSRFGYFGWPSVVRLPDATLAMAASGFRLEHVCPFGKGVICYSRDEGATWTAPAVVLDTPLDDRDCGLVCFDGGRVMLTSFNNTVAMQRRANERRQADSPQAAADKALIDAYLDCVALTDAESRFLGSTYRISEDGGYAFGPIRRAPVSAPHGPCALRDGTLLYIGRRFSADDSFDAGERPFVECWRFAGDSFQKLSTIENVWDAHGLLMSCEPHAVALPDGRIIVHIRVQRAGAQRAFTIYQAESADGGLTFSAPRPLLGHLGGAPAHLLLHSSGVLLSAYGHREAPFGIRLMFSLDDGQHWDVDWVLDDQGENGDLGYPATVELADGRLLTVYYENANGSAVIAQKIWQLPAL